MSIFVLLYECIQKPITKITFLGVILYIEQDKLVQF